MCIFHYFSLGLIYFICATLVVYVTYYSVFYLSATFSP